MRKKTVAIHGMFIQQSKYIRKKCQVCIALSCFCDMVLFFLLPDVLVFGLGKRGSCLNGFAARGATHSIDTCSEGVLRDCEVVVRA